MTPTRRTAAVLGAALAATLALASTMPATAAGRGPDSGQARGSLAGYDAEAWLATIDGIEKISEEVGEIEGVNPGIVAANLARSALATPEIVPCASLQTGDVAILPPSEVEGTSAICGYIDVPERYDVVASKSIRLAYVLLESPSSTPDPAASIQLAGGPGQGSTQFAALTFANPEVETVEERLRATRDVLFLDQRGTGASQPALDCPASVAVDLDTAVLETKSCRDSLVAAGVDLSGFTTLSNSIDQFVVRTALRYPQVGLNGTSYGAKLAYQTTRWDTGWIGDVVVGSPVSGENYLTTQPTSFQSALTAVVEDCAAQPACAAVYPDTAGALDRVSARLVAEPQEVAFTSLIDGTEKSLVVDGLSFSVLIYQLIFGGGASQVPTLASTADEGNLAPVAAFLDLVSSGGGSGSARGMFLSVVCAEEGASFDAEERASRAAETQPVVQEFFTFDAVSPYCPTWDVPAADPATYAPDPASGEASLLVVAGRYDPITPPAFGEQIVEANPDSQLVIAAASGHDPLSFLGTCAADIVDQYISGADVDASCAATPTEFVLPQSAENAAPAIPEEMREQMPAPMG